MARSRFLWARTGAFRALWPFRNFSWSLSGPFSTTAGGGVQLSAALACYPPSTLCKIISSNRVGWGVAGPYQKTARRLPDTYVGIPTRQGCGGHRRKEVDQSERIGSCPRTKAPRWLLQASSRGWWGGGGAFSLRNCPGPGTPRRGPTAAPTRGTSGASGRGLWAVGDTTASECR